MLLAASCGGGGSSSPSTDTGFVATSIEDALDYGVGRGLDGLWVYVDDGVSAPVSMAAGIQNRSTLDPARPDTPFKIASISKMFITVAATKVIHADMLRQQDTLAFWLPALADRIENAETITVRELLLHRSGVPDFDSQPGFSWTSSHPDVNALLAYALDKPADFPPDQRYEYSNTNYLLLGKILDAALGYSHHDYVQQAILSPLGMHNTWSLMTGANAALLAHGYWDGIDRTGQQYVAPGGSMISTASDVGKFLRALATGSLLDSDERLIYRSMFGYGHSGWLPGYQSIARYHVTGDTVLVLFVNTTGGASEQVTGTVYDSLLTYLNLR